MITDADIKKLVLQLAAVQDQAQELDNMLKDIRVKLNDAIWDLAEMRKGERTQK